MLSAQNAAVNLCYPLQCQHCWQSVVWILGCIIVIGPVLFKDLGEVAGGSGFNALAFHCVGMGRVSSPRLSRVLLYYSITIQSVSYQLSPAYLLTSEDTGVSADHDLKLKWDACFFIFVNVTDHLLL